MTNNKGGNMSDNSKQARFDSLINNYAVAAYVTDQILDSPLLERKIKLGNDIDKINEFYALLLPSLANAIRRGEKIKGITLDDHALDIANAYFTELNTYGGEWENADLIDLFTEYKAEAEQEAKENDY